MTYEVIPQTFSELEGPWQDLLDSGASHTIFATPVWLGTWWQEFHQERELLLLSIRRNGQIVGIAPLMRKKDEIYFIGDREVTDYRDFVLAPGQEEEAFHALLDHLELLDWHRLMLGGIPPNSPVLRYLLPLAQRRGLKPEAKIEDVCPALQLPALWEDYLAYLPKKERHELRRKFRRLYQAGEIDYYALPQPSASEIDDFLQLMRECHPHKAEFLTPKMARFFAALADSLSKYGYLRLYFMEVNGVRASTVMAFDYRDTLYIYNSGYRRDFSKLSVGLLLKALCIKDAIDAGKRCFDFLRGAEPYKYDLGAYDQPIYRCIIERD